MTARLPVTADLFTERDKVFLALELGGHGSTNVAGAKGLVTGAQAAAWLRRTADDIEAVSSEMAATVAARSEDDRRVHIVVASTSNRATEYARHSLDVGRRNLLVVTGVYGSEAASRLRGVMGDNVLVHVVDTGAYTEARPMLLGWAATVGVSLDILISRGDAYRAARTKAVADRG